MICQPCQDNQHDQCPNGTRCDCQHRIRNSDYESYAQKSVASIKANRPDQPDWVFAAGVDAEAGEFMSAYLRYTGTVRRSGTLADVAGELADVVLCAYRAACVLGIDLPTAIETKIDVEDQRGF
jgi:NTP pyrophosphatase (non-canonical NTP hydrolase)